MYRLLEAGEMIKSTDELYNADNCDWESCNCDCYEGCIFEPVNEHFPVRRKINVRDFPIHIKVDDISEQIGRVAKQIILDGDLFNDINT
jgi:hypothetical protein